MYVYVCVHHLRSERCWDLASLQFLPVDAAEEGVSLDLSLSDPRLAAESSGRVLSQKLRGEKRGEKRDGPPLTYTENNVQHITRERERETQETPSMYLLPPTHPSHCLYTSPSLSPIAHF